MKTKDSKFILGDNKVVELFLMSEMASVSTFVRGLLMQAQFYSISPDNIAKWLSEEVIWQDKVHKEYQRFVGSHSLSVAQEIDKESYSLF